MSHRLIKDSFRWRNTLKSEIYQDSLIGVAFAYSGAASASIEKRNVNLCGKDDFAIFWQLRHQYGISGRESQTSLFAFATLNPDGSLTVLII